MSEQLRCELCGIEAHAIVARLVEWRPEVVKRTGRGPWESIARCPDYQGCRARVEAKGGRWPVRDTWTKPTVKPAQQREEVPA